MDQIFEENMDAREVIKEKLCQYFDGKIVRKDLTKKIKEGANVLVYVLEFLLGQYCSSDDDEVIEQGVENVKRILADNFVRSDEAQKILFVLRSKGSRTVIDKTTVQLDYEYIEEDQKNGNPIKIRKLTPIQMLHVYINELKEGFYQGRMDMMSFFVPLAWSRTH